MKTTDPVLLRAVPLLLLIIIALVAGQRGIPLEDGGEIITVSRLGGVCHPPGMPILALLSRSVWVIFETYGLRVLFALFAGLAMWFLSRRTGLPGLVLACGMLLLPAFRERLLAWDAYSPLFLLFAAGITAGSVGSMAAGYLTGLAIAVHPAGVFMPLVLRVRRFTPLPAAAGLALGLSLYLALPLGSAAGTVVDWGSCGSVGNFMRQVTAGGYREVYGASIGRFSLSALALHLGVLWRILWPVMILPVLMGLFRLWREGRKRLLRTATLVLIADALFVWIVNPMAAGTSQTGVLSLLVLAVLALQGIHAISGSRAAGWAIAAAVLTVGLLSQDPLGNQEDDVHRFFSPAPLNSGFFISDNDLLYGGWMIKYTRDIRPDIVLLSTANFSGWFEDMAVHFNPELDLSRSAADVGGLELGRSELIRRLIQSTIEDNPHLQFFGDR